MTLKQIEKKLRIPELKRLMKKNFLILFFFMIFIGIIRNLLEMIGLFTGSTNYTSFYPNFAGFMNSITYVFLMIIAEGFLINLLLKGNNKQLRLLINKGSFLLLYLFILIPIFNILFNYHFLKLPILFDLTFIHPLLFPHYGPVGIHVAFILVVFYFPFWLKKIYKVEFIKRLGTVLIVYISHYLIYYQLTMMFCFGSLTKYNSFFSRYAPVIKDAFPNPYHVNIYSATFILPVLFIYPFFMMHYSENKKELNKTTMVYILLWIVFIMLFFINRG